MAAAPVTADDLEFIEGIGPKIARIFQEAGVTTFAQLAALDASQMSEMMQRAGIRLADPTTWAEQARLAAASEFDALQVLQDQLKGGRHV